jgi:hypothetical protein
LHSAGDGHRGRRGAAEHDDDCELSEGTFTNIRFTDGAGGNGVLDGDSSGLQTINGDPITLVADATNPDTIVYGVAGGSVVFAVHMVVN